MKQILLCYTTTMFTKSVCIPLVLLYNHLQYINLVTVHNTSSPHRVHTDRIKRGGSASIQDYPFVACLVKTGNFLGGAVIISSYWAITAGHGIDNISDFDIINRTAFVRSNTNFWRNNYIDHTIVKKMVHESYNRITFDYDVALLKVKNAFNGTYEKPIPLPTSSQNFSETHVTALGWGSTDPARSMASEELQEIFIYLADHDTCKTIYGKMDKVTDRMICAGSPFKEACVYDCGGPLVQNGTLVGIMSWGPDPCVNPRFPGVYTRVSYFTPWIEETFKQDDYYFK